MNYTVEIDDELEDWEWADAKDELMLALEELGDTLHVAGVNIGWTHGSGAGLVESNEAWKFLAINGEFRLKAEVAEDSVYVVRYSHDEPVGASFTFRKATDEEVQ